MRGRETGLRFGFPKRLLDAPIQLWQQAGMGGDRLGSRSAAHVVVFVCAAQVLVQIGAFFWPALLPGMIDRWALTNSEAGWITSIFYAAYIASVPVLVTLTDRIDAKRVYLTGVAATVLGHLLFAFFADGFLSALVARALAGVGWAGTYMTGLKLLADTVDAKLMSRAAAGHAASIGISGALSFACADWIAEMWGWRFAFLAAGISAALAWLLIALTVPGGGQHPLQVKSDGALFDFRHVLRNRSAMAYAIAYCVHTLEMSAVRGWGVAFLGFVALRTDWPDPTLSPTATLTALGLAGTLTSVLGNEAAIVLGRRRLIFFAMTGSAACAILLGFLGSGSYPLAVALMLIYGPIVWLDSSSLTAGTAGTAEPSRRGATLAVHSMLGYIGGFIGPLAVGWILDWRGGMSPAAWTSAFTMVAVLTVLALTAFLIMRPSGLAGDRRGSKTV
jgi:predicted MFS family arabinose efflux permease